MSAPFISWRINCSHERSDSTSSCTISRCCPSSQPHAAVSMLHKSLRVPATIVPLSNCSSLPTGAKNFLVATSHSQSFRTPVLLISTMWAIASAVSSCDHSAPSTTIAVGGVSASAGKCPLAAPPSMAESALSTTVPIVKDPVNADNCPLTFSSTRDRDADQCLLSSVARTEPCGVRVCRCDHSSLAARPAVPRPPRSWEPST